MKDTMRTIEVLQARQLDERLLEIYVDEEQLDYQRNRYINAVRKYEMIFDMNEIFIYSAPGRSEIGGNHTDHQHGEVLAAALNVDVIAVVGRIEADEVCIFSEGYKQFTISLDDLEVKEEEKGKTEALVRGILFELKEKGYTIGGFQAYITSDVLVGAGLSSSAAFETLIGTIVSGLYNEMSILPVEIAMAGHHAENVYFGKPCGMMDQMACSYGNLIHIDFENVQKPLVEKIDCDFEKSGYSLCITDTKSSHEDCTPEYAAVPREMKAVAAVFEKEVLREVDKEELLQNISMVRAQSGDRATLRAIHVMMENERVNKEAEALKTGDFEAFLQFVKASGDSSFKYLQNVYMNQDIVHQNVSIALALSDVILGRNGVSRVHGGGFAGTIQAFVKNEAVEKYQKYMDEVFGSGACHVYQIRRYGGVKVI